MQYWSGISIEAESGGPESEFGCDDDEQRMDVKHLNIKPKSNRCSWLLVIHSMWNQSIWTKDRNGFKSQHWVSSIHKHKIVTYPKILEYSFSQLVKSLIETMSTIVTSLLLLNQNDSFQSSFTTLQLKQNEIKITICYEVFVPWNVIKHCLMIEWFSIY